jgi:dUTP pyrophosphatase
MNLARFLVKRLHPNATLPQRTTTGAACYDLSAVDAITIPPCAVAANGHIDVGQALVPTGLAMAIPSGYAGRIGARSGLSIKHNIEVGAGWIDSDYRGEIKVKLINLSSCPFLIQPGDRIAQIALLCIATPIPEEVEELPLTTRDQGGFGSTGIEKRFW